jgi:2-isopropylmalate synthase
MEPILIYDTTLRDGTQGENITFTADEKMKIAQRLDEMGIHYIEGGWPGSNPRDIRFFDLAKRERFKTARSRPSGPPAGASRPPTMTNLKRL